jgi:hypothetical protein
MMSSIFWDITPGFLLRVNRHFSGTCSPCLCGCRVSHARNQHEAGRKLCKLSCKIGNEEFYHLNVMPCSLSFAAILHAGFLLGLLFNPVDRDDTFLRKVGRLSTNYMALCSRTQNTFKQFIISKEMLHITQM